MALGALDRGRHDPADTAGEIRPSHAVAITGVAGPGGGSDEKPVGTVYVARASSDGSCDVRRFKFNGERAAVREWSARAAMWMLWMKLRTDDPAATPLLGQVRG